MQAKSEANRQSVNGILLHHNIEKQMSDSRGEIAYLMADISDVKEEEIRDLFQSLEELSCKMFANLTTRRRKLIRAACIRTRVLY
jgi:dGTP triphosphohydrolase